MTKYVVLELVEFRALNEDAFASSDIVAPDDVENVAAWQAVATVDADNDQQAIRKALADEEPPTSGTYVAVAVRWWRPIETEAVMELRFKQTALDVPEPQSLKA